MSIARVRDGRVAAAVEEAIEFLAGIAEVTRGRDRILLKPNLDGLFWEELVLSRAVLETDLVCSVAMMKTHLCATVSLTPNNAIGLYPGVVYGSYRWWVHDNALLGQSRGVAFEILDMARVNRLGLSVMDATTAMEGEGPIAGTLVPMNLVIAGTDALLPAPVPRCEAIGGGRAAITWNEEAPRAVLRYNLAGKARVAWTNPPTARASILERNEGLRSSGWQRVVPSTPGRHEFDATQAATTFYRLRQP